MATSKPLPGRATATFARRLTAARERAGWTRYRLSREAGVTQTTLADLEEGGQVPSLETAASLARALGVRVGELVD